MIGDSWVETGTLIIHIFPCNKSIESNKIKLIWALASRDLQML